MKKFINYTIFLILCNVFPVASQNTNLPIDKITLPAGFSIALWARVPDVKTLALGKNGTVFAGSGSHGKVYAITDNNGKRKIRTIARGLKMPTGVAFKNGALYVAAINRILRFAHIEDHLDQPAKPQVIINTLPKEKFHGARFIAFGPDEKLYVSIGAPCNICQPDPNKFAQISRLNLDGSNFEIYAQGVRHSVGFDWHPETRELWFTDSGNAWMGENIPADELNVAAKQGMHFGFPFCHASNVLDTKFGARRGCNQSTPPAIEFDAHVAPQGMRFYTGKMFPSAYHNQVFVAQHGSWNRREPIGFQIESVHIQNNKVLKRERFAEGWLQDGRAWGKPVDILVMPDGALLVSDDYAGAIYRISYQQP